jgi:streptogramin lyase
LDEGSPHGKVFDDMKGWRVFPLVAALFCASTRGEFIVSWQRMMHVHDEKTGAHLSNMTNSFNSETVDAIAFGPDGDIYGIVNSMGSGAVFRWDPASGNYKNVFVPYGQGVSIPCALQFGPDGDLYIACMDWSMNPYILRCDGRTGAFKSRFVEGTDQIRSPWGLVFGPDGNLYVASGEVGIVRYQGGTGEFIDIFTPHHSEFPNGLSAVAFESSGNLVWLDKNVYRVNGQTGEIMQTLIEAPAGRNWAEMILGPDGDIYISAQGSLDIWRFDGKTGASRGVFIKGPDDPHPWITGLAFSNNRVRIGSNITGTVITWPQTFGNFELQTRALDESDWRPVSGTPKNLGLELSLELPFEAISQIFRLKKL